MQYRIVPNLVYDINTDNANRDDYLDLARYIYPQIASTTNSSISPRLVAETPCEINDNTFGAIPHIVPYSDGAYDYRQGNLSSPQYTVPADYGYDRFVPGTLPDEYANNLPDDYGYTNHNYPMFDEAYPSVGKTYPTIGKSYPTVDESFERVIPVDYEKARQYNEIVNKISNLQAKIKEEEEDILTLDKMIYKKKDKISDYEKEIVRLKSMYNR